MDFSAIIPGLIGAVGVPLVAYLFGLLLPRKVTHGVGYKLGSLLSALGQKKVGKFAWEKVEDRIQSSVDDFVQGVQAGLDSDDK